MRLIDTNILIDSVDKSSPNLRRAQEVLTYYMGASEAVISLQSIAEMYSALTKRYTPKEAREIVEDLTKSDTFKRIFPDEGAYALALSMAEKHNLRRGKFFDALLAATAKRNGIEIILTEDTKHFSKFGLKVETLETATLSKGF